MTKAPKKIKNPAPTKSTDRRGFLKAAGAVAATGVLVACGSENESANGAAPATVGETKHKLKMVTTWPKNFPGMGVSAQRFADRVREATAGRIDIELYAAGELVPALGAFDAVSSGKADIYHGAEYYWQGKSKAFNFFAAVPFGMTADEMAAWIYHDGGQELWDELSAGFNIKPLLGGSSGVQMGGWFRKEINTVGDLNGLRMRIPGLGGEVMSRLGATPVTKAGGEIFLALSQGNIDATEWVGPWNDLAFGFHEVAKHYYYPGFHEPGTAFALGFNLAKWNDFSAKDQELFRMASQAEYTYTLADYNANNARALDTLINEHGVDLRRFSDDILSEMGRISGEVLLEAAASDDMTGRVYESFKSSLGRGQRWGAISELAIRNARLLNK